MFNGISSSNPERKRGPEEKEVDLEVLLGLNSAPNLFEIEIGDEIFCFGLGILATDVGCLFGGSWTFLLVWEILLESCKRLWLTVGGEKFFPNMAGTLERGDFEFSMIVWDFGEVLIVGWLENGCSNNYWWSLLGRCGEWEVLIVGWLENGCSK